MSLFAGKRAEEYEAMRQSLIGCAGGDSNDEIYSFLENTPKTTLVVFLVDQLHELGFKIVKTPYEKQKTK